MNRTAVILVAAFLIAAGFWVAGELGRQQGDDSLVGGDRDVHGCVGSAGYVWCENAQRCIRPWEENCPTDERAVGLANPAAVYCKEKGHGYRIVEDEEGDQSGECLTPEGVWVDEWAFYRGEINVAGHSVDVPEEEGFEVVETTDVSCAADEECETPGRYLVMSHCPYASKCIEGSCAIICPRPFEGRALASDEASRQGA